MRERITARPELNNVLDGKTFLKWYWLKEELTGFCKANGIPASGSKNELTERIACFLDTGKVPAVTKIRRVSSKVTSINLDSLIEPDLVCSEVHRAFFKEHIGASFSFNVAFDKQFEYNTYVRDFMAANKGRSLNDAIKCWNYKKSMPGHNRYEDSDRSVLE